jgi:type II secretory pathway pseudopilin PulG
MEMMLALTLFAVGTVALIQLLQRGQSGMTEGENVLTAVHLARRCQEALRNVPYANLTLQANSVCTIPAGAPFSRFSRTVTVTPQTSVPPYNTANLTRLDVQISWNAPGTGETANVTLSALRSAL